MLGSRRFVVGLALTSALLVPAVALATTYIYLGKGVGKTYIGQNAHTAATILSPSYHFSKKDTQLQLHGVPLVRGQEDVERPLPDRAVRPKRSSDLSLPDQLEQLSHHQGSQGRLRGDDLVTSREVPLPRRGRS